MRPTKMQVYVLIEAKVRVDSQARLITARNHIQSSSPNFRCWKQAVSRKWKEGFVCR